MATERKRVSKDQIYDNWAKRNVHFEVELEESVIRQLADYGSGATRYNAARGCILGAGYEVYILAFFIGLYAGVRRPLEGETKAFGQPVQYWGNLESRGERSGYPRLREYIFAAAVARTDFDLLAIERGDTPLSKGISAMILTMDEYANYGLHLMKDYLEEDRHYFSGNTAMLNLFLPLFEKMNAGYVHDDVADGDDDPDPEPLD